MKKGILINVKNETIEMVEVQDGLQGIYSLVDCELIEVVNLDDTNDIYVDEMGLLELNQDTKFFTFEGGDQPYSGNGLVLGVDDDGDSCDTTFDINVLRRTVKFHTLSQVIKMIS